MPDLKKEEVEVFVDGVPAEILSFDPVQVQCMTRVSVLGYYLEALLPDSVARGKHVLTLVVYHKTKDLDGKDVFEQGQAHYCGLVFPELW